MDGLVEQPNETWEATKDKVQCLLRDKLELGPAELERAHRVGKRTSMPTATRPHTVIARFAKFNDRQTAQPNIEHQYLLSLRSLYASKKGSAAGNEEGEGEGKDRLLFSHTTSDKRHSGTVPRHLGMGPEDR